MYIRYISVPNVNLAITFNFAFSKVPYEERVDTVIGWLLMNKTERPDFMTLYFNEPDHQGHGTGPDSPEVCTQMLMRF